MFQMDLKARFHNKAFLIALVSAILLLLKNFGLGQYIPENIDSIVNGFITIGILLGVITDTSTPGISDQISTSNRQAANVKVEVPNISQVDAKAFFEEASKIRLQEYSEKPTVEIKSLDKDNTSQITANDNSINSNVQPTENLNASAKTIVDPPIEG